MLVACAGLAYSLILTPALARSNASHHIAAQPQDEGDRQGERDVEPGRTLRRLREAMAGLGQDQANNPLAGPPGTSPARVDPAEAPDVDGAVLALLDQVYLTEDERVDLRIKHGLWEAGDVSQPEGDKDARTIARQARAALTRGDISHASLAHTKQLEDADPDILLDCAEAALRAGTPEATLTLIHAIQQAQAKAPKGGNPPSLRALRLRGEALMELGKRDDAEAALDALPDLLAAGPGNADEVAEGVRGLILLARLRGAEGKDSVGYQEQLNYLGDARDRLDRLSWRVRLAEALLLYEKGEYEQAGPALMETLSHNPRSAEAWMLLGRIWVDAMEFEKAAQVAARLDALASDDAGSTGAAPDAIAPDAATSVPPAPSLGGSMIRAMVRMRQVEGQLALEDLAPALQTFPTNRELLGLQAAAVALSFDFAKSDALLNALDALSPGHAEGYLLAGKALAGARQYEDAARLLRIASERAPGWAEPLYQLGLSELQAGRLEESKQALQLGLALDRKHVRSSNSLALLEELATYKTLEGEHFIIRYKQGPDEVMAREMLPTLERIFARVTGDAPGGIRHVPKAKTVVELYPNHRWFATRITGLPQLHTFAAATGPVIAMEVPRDGPGHLVGPYDWARVVQHEYTHTVTLSRTKNRLPHWFTEASAVYLEDAPVDYNVVQLLTRAWQTDDFFDFETINVMFARPRRPTDRTQAYMQGAQMYAFIIDRFGMEAPLELMDLYASGLREEQAFQQVLKVSRSEFLSQFKDWFEVRLREWGMIAKPGQSELDELVEQSKVEELTPDVLAQWLEREPSNPFVLERLTQSISDRGVRPSDEPTLLAHASARPVDPLPHKLLARLYLTLAPDQEGQQDALVPAMAIPHLEFLDAREQHTPSYASQLATLYANEGQWPQALAKIRRATQIAPYDATLREQAATLALRAGDWTTAEGHIWALTMLEPDRAIHKQRLDAVRQRGQTKRATPQATPQAEPQSEPK